MVSPAVSNRSLTASEMPAAGCSGRARKIPSVMLAGMRVRDLNWMQLEDYLEGDDRIVLPLGSTEQHAYLSLETDNILAERVSVEAAEPLGVPVLPVLAYGITPLFAAYPGSPSLSAETYLRVVARAARFALRAGVPARPARQRARRQHAGAAGGVRVDGRERGSAGDLPRLVDRAGGMPPWFARSSPRRMPRGWRTSRGRGWQASSYPPSRKPSLDLAALRARGPRRGARAARRRIVRRDVPALRRGSDARLGGGRGRGAVFARVRVGLLIEVRQARQRRGSAALPRSARAVFPGTGTLEGFRHRERTWDAVNLVALLDGEPAGSGWTGPRQQGALWCGFGVVSSVAADAESGRRSTARSRTWRASVSSKGCFIEVLQSDPESLAWVERRGFDEVERQEALALDLTSSSSPAPVEVPDGRRDRHARRAARSGA